MNRTYIVSICIFMCLITLGLLYRNISGVKNQIPAANMQITPTKSAAQVEYYLDRHSLSDQPISISPLPSQGASQSGEKIQEISDKYERNYPYNTLFPFKSPAVSVSYRLEPKRLYMETTLDATSAFATFDAYLKTYNLKRSDLEQQGVEIIFVKPSNGFETSTRE